MEPPKDRNFLGKIVTFAWSSEICQHVRTGTKWVECFWHDGNLFGEPCYAEWCGRKGTLSSRAIVEDWRELPDE